VLARAYGVSDVTLHRLVEGKLVYRVTRPGGPPWVLRAGAGALRYAAALYYLQQRGVATTRLVPTREGALVAQLEAEGTDHPAHPVVVTTFVPGETPAFRPPSLRRVGEALGRLHAMGVAGPVPACASGGPEALPALPRAGMLPRNELAFARACLQRVAGRVPAAHSARYEALWAACDALDLCEDLPTVFLHGDCHPWNSVLTPEGEAVLIDWDSAGPGPAVIDVGFLLLSCDTGGLTGPVVAPDPARMAAVVAGYRQYHTLTAAELDRLADAVRFRTLVGAAASFATLIERGRDPHEAPWWWQRYLGAAPLAERARRHFTRGG
jgi:Ser/Thr protein kinase RdoA (MazF antagonist)